MPKNEQAGTLVERIEASVRDVDFIINVHALSGYETTVRNAQNIMQTLIDCKTFITAKPLDDAELEERYKLIHNDLIGIVYLAEAGRPTGGTIDSVLVFVTALHDALSRKQAEVVEMEREIDELCRERDYYRENWMERVGLP